MKYGAFLFFTAILLGDDIEEVVNCQNGMFGQISIIDIPNVAVQGTTVFLRQSQCDSKVAIPRVAPGTCNVMFVGMLVPTPVTTPSSTTPVLSYFDAGPQVLVNGPAGELKMPRNVNGGLTSYSFTNSNRPAPFLAAGRYEITTDAGRDLPALKLAVDYSPLMISAPAMNSSLTSANLPSISWTGGSSAMRQDIELQLRAGTRDGRRVYDIRCRLGDASTSGEFTLPREIWEQVPADVRATGVATMVLSHSGLVAKLPVEQLDGGIEVYFPQFPGVGIQLVP